MLDPTPPGTPVTPTRLRQGTLVMLQMEGALRKRGGLLQSGWQWRYFVLENHQLAYSKTQGGQQCGVLDLRRAEVTIVEAEGVWEFVLKGPNFLKQKDYHLRANTEEEREEWVEVCREASSLPGGDVTDGEDGQDRHTWLNRLVSNVTGNYSQWSDKAKDFLQAQAHRAVFVHGDIELVIHEARRLPNLDIGACGLTDAYVRIKVDGKKGPRTQTIDDNLDPVWEEEFSLPVTGKVTMITLDVKDEDAFAPEQVGQVHIFIKDIVESGGAGTPPSDGEEGQWFGIPGGGQIRVTCVYVPADARQQEVSVLKSPWEIREGCQMLLYQDAHCSLAPGPLVALPRDAPPPRDAWCDVLTTLNEATKFIYITGWSVWADTALLRDGEHHSGHLGELLKKKAEEGVAVRLLIWDELMSMDNVVLNACFEATKTGLMGTHDKETRKYFADTPVLCQLVQRRGKGVRADGKLNAVTAGLGYLGTEAIFTHHQKTIICDSPAPPGKKTPTTPNAPKSIVAFVGGLDLTGGRFDTPAHSLFGTLQTVHKGDFYQPLPGFDETLGPRQPWHDIHSRVAGPIARDVLANFEQRWRRQAKRTWRTLLYTIEEPEFLPTHADVYTGKDAWKAQMFRSIDDFSADMRSSSTKPLPIPPARDEAVTPVGTPTDRGRAGTGAAAASPRETAPRPSGPLRGVEPGIQEAYIHHIRRAKRFIYIENQYFLGSSRAWEDFDDKQWNVECKHQVPLELVTRIESRIRDKQRFAAYVVLPLHPEGVPESGPVQAILNWQYRTIAMMYGRIASTLEELGMTDSHPTDYLNFFCLGQREPHDGPTTLSKDERQRALCRSRRHMIYVHSKMMVVDDEYIIVGSANINERSMAGDRDTEIAVGGMQPKFTLDKDKYPRGAVSHFRVSCWVEHLGHFNNLYLKPHELKCVQYVQEAANQNWDCYLATDPRDLPGHLLRYPYVVEKDGTVAAHPMTYFPDCTKYGARILGAPQNVIPNLLTT